MLMEVFNLALVPSYTLFCVFVIFSYQEINNKIRTAYNNFRDWVKFRLKDGNQEGALLKALGIDKEPDSWLEKDVIFQIFYFYKNVLFKEIKPYENAATDYYKYTKEYLKFKKYILRLLLYLTILMPIIFHLSILQNYDWILLIYYILTIACIFEILKGPKPRLFNNAIENRAGDECLKGAEKEIEELKKLVYSI